MPAHLTLFQHLPPSAEAEIRARLSAETRGVKAPPARIAGVMALDAGTALRVESPALKAIRDRLAEAFHGLLIPQDAAGWLPHVTIQNKATPQDARALQRTLREGFRPWALAMTGLGVWRYKGRAWEPVSRHMFK